MASYRDAYPSGAASASAAYRYVGDSLRTYDASATGLFGGGHVSNPLGFLSRSSLYGYDLALHNPLDWNGNELLPDTPRETIYGPGYFGGETGRVHAYAGVDSRGGRRGWCKIDRSVLDRRTLHFGEHCSSTYGHLSDAYVTGTHHKERTERMPPPPSQASSRKRKTPSLDEIIKETWELHALFREGLTEASDVTESADDTPPREEGGKHGLSTSNPDGADQTKADTLLPREPLSGWTRELDNNVVSDTTSSWKTLDFSSKERIEDGSSDKHESLHALGLQRSACKGVMEFLGNYSDDDSADDNGIVDSDDETPNDVDSSHCDVKSREELAYEFFLDAFSENKELQKLYSEQCNVGKFECLVCSSIPGKPPKKYIGLSSVIMHASKIINTKRKQEHRGYARALCSVLGWDLCRLPSAAGSLSPHPRCCIPVDRKEKEDAKGTNETIEGNGTECVKIGSREEQ